MVAILPHRSSLPRLCWCRSPYGCARGRTKAQLLIYCHDLLASAPVRVETCSDQCSKNEQRQERIERATGAAAFGWETLQPTRAGEYDGLGVGGCDRKNGGDLMVEARRQQTPGASRVL